MEEECEPFREGVAFCEVTCPTCFEGFQVSVLPRSECPAELDYDCEVCCRPMVLRYSDDGYALAVGMND